MKKFSILMLVLGLFALNGNAFAAAENAAERALRVGNYFKDPAYDTQKDKEHFSEQILGVRKGVNLDILQKAYDDIAEEIGTSRLSDTLRLQAVNSLIAAYDILAPFSPASSTPTKVAQPAAQPLGAVQPAGASGAQDRLSKLQQLRQQQRAVFGQRK